ncbi:SO2930 family diheme c-type cytochrome [Rapidithrix thailandica]|uniref:SO2930 family diheme c-type cytochrome n=1 Tax=Rapidithrix thailandica TaxID=413964 RepID=A0AAW9S2K7_9BACT
MQKHLYILIGIFAMVMLGSSWIQLSKSAQPTFAPNTRLSDYGLFKGDIAELQPAQGVFAYELNSPLFTDYAYKFRVVKLPDGSPMQYKPEQAFDFPVGTIIAKTFYYPKDFRKLHKGRQLIETRILMHQEEGWVAFPYVWNEAQTEAYLDVAGNIQAVTWINEKGKKMKTNYVVPNMNQCKGCHAFDDKIIPIGPTARQLNRPSPFEDEKPNQLVQWAAQGKLAGLPSPDQIPQMAVWDNPSQASLGLRARAWLDANCAHCHNAHGPANTSGLFLNWHQSDSTTWGVNKTPVAAGRGSGGRLYTIVPGKPHESILMYRIASNDPGVMMPELGRTLVHKEGVELIEEWIRSMEPQP